MLPKTLQNEAYESPNNAAEQGEDEHWSRTAKNAGFNLWCDISLFNYHAMEQSILDYFVEKGFVEKI